MPRIPATSEEARKVLLNAKPEWLGQFGEAIVSRCLAASGWRYVSLSKICEGGAPLARGRNGHLILPDFDAMRDGKSVFVEAKAKTQSIVYWQKRQERHGIDEKNFIAYQEIQKESGKPCCIAIVELQREDRDSGQLSWSGSILFEKLGNLLDPRSEHPEIPRKVYWCRKNFCELESGLDPLELFELANGGMTRSYECELQQILYPHKQQPLFT